MALGAARGDVMRMVLRRGAALVGWGAGIGLAAALVATRALQTLLHDVSVTDAVSFAAAAGILAIAALLATLIPARRAINVEPMAALRGE